MKRDMDLVREILLATEASEDSPLGWIDLDSIDRPLVELSYHVGLLDDAGLIVAQDISSMSAYDVKPKRLTWAGHEFLDTIRDPSIWDSTKRGAEQAGGFSLELLAALARGFVKKKVEEQTGIELDL